MHRPLLLRVHRPLLLVLLVLRLGRCGGRPDGNFAGGEGAHVFGVGEFEEIICVGGEGGEECVGGDGVCDYQGLECCYNVVGWRGR
jgi:hypothetical protein